MKLDQFGYNLIHSVSNKFTAIILRFVVRLNTVYTFIKLKVRVLGQWL